MKVAIIGAGLSGLSCAHELERYGVYPTIYEDLDFIGDRESHVAGILQISDRPIKDAMAFFQNICHINIQPLSTITKISHHSPSVSRTIKGSNLGYLLKRGKDADAIKGQLSAQLSGSKILFGQKPDLKKLALENDYVVVANNLNEAAKSLGCWTDLIQGWLKGAVVEGEFDPHEMIIWLNRMYCRNGYVYLCPFDAKHAQVAVFIPHSTEREVDYYWKQFLQMENIPYPIVEEFSVQHFSGKVYPHKVNNIYFIGGAGGAVEPFLGFGQLNSISSGVFAARSLVEGLDYEKLMNPFIKKQMDYHEIRKAFNKMKNKDFDTLIKFIAMPGIRNVIYHTSINISSLLAGVLRMCNRRKTDKQH